MAKHRIKNVVCTVTKSSGGSPVTFTDRLDYAAFVRMADELEATTMGSDGHEEWLGGFEGGFVELVFQQDFDAGQVNDTLKDELGKIITVELQPNPNGQTTVSPTNPKWDLQVPGVNAARVRRQRQAALAHLAEDAPVRQAGEVHHAVSDEDDFSQYDEFEDDDYTRSASRPSSSTTRTTRLSRSPRSPGTWWSWS